MHRRSFLRLLGFTAPVIAAKPTYFFAPIGGWESEVIANPYINSVSPATLEEIMAHVAYQNFFVDTPLHAWARMGIA